MEALTAFACAYGAQFIEGSFLASALYFAGKYNNLEQFSSESLLFTTLNDHSQASSTLNLQAIPISEASLTTKAYSLANIDLPQVKPVVPEINLEGNNQTDSTCISYGDNFVNAKTPVGTFTLSIQPKELRGAEIQWQKQVNQYIAEAQKTLFMAANSPQYLSALARQTEQTTKLLMATNSSNLLERMASRILINHMRLPAPYDGYLQEALDQLNRQFFHNDGSLNTSIGQEAFANQVIEKFIHRIQKNACWKNNYGDLCYNLPSVKDKGLVSKWLDGLQRFGRGSHLQSRIQGNLFNQQILDCIELCENGEFIKAIELYENSGQPFLKKLYLDYFDAFKKAHCDSAGILTIAKYDPLCLNMPANKIQEITSDHKKLHALNQLLALRYSLVTDMQKAWNIPTNCSAKVLHALYSIADNPKVLSDPQSLLAGIYKAVTQYPSKEAKEIIKALHLPNGIIKDFAHYTRSKMLSIPSEILKLNHAQLREQINKLVHIEHSLPETKAGKQATLTLDTIQAISKSFKSNPEIIKEINQTLQSIKTGGQLERSKSLTTTEESELAHKQETPQTPKSKPIPKQKQSGGSGQKPPNEDEEKKKNTIKKYHEKAFDKDHMFNDKHKLENLGKSKEEILKIIKDLELIRKLNK